MKLKKKFRYGRIRRKKKKKKKKNKRYNNKMKSLRDFIIKKSAKTIVSPEGVRGSLITYGDDLHIACQMPHVHCTVGLFYIQRYTDKEL